MRHVRKKTDGLRPAVFPEKPRILLFTLSALLLLTGPTAYGQSSPTEMVTPPAAGLPASPSAAPVPPAVSLPAPPPAAAIPQEPEKRTSKLITLNFVNADLRDIFTSIAEQANVNILVGSDVSGPLSIGLKDVSVETAIDAITKAAGLRLTKNNNVYIINKGALPFVEELPVPEKPSPTVSVNVRDADLGRVVNNLANQAGVDLVIFGVMSERVTARITNVPLNDALKIILSGTRYTYRVTEDNKYIFGDPMSLPPGSTAIVSSEVVYLNYMKSKDLMGLLPSNISASNLKPVDDLNAIIVTGADDYRGMVKRLISNLDKPAQQVVMDTLVVELSQSASKELRYSIGDLLKPTQMGQTTIDFPGFTATIDSTLAPASTLFAKIRLYIANGQGKIKANPRISTYNGKDANINVVRDFTFKVSTSTPAGLVTQVQTVQAGTSLKVIPYIGAAGDVLTEIHAEVSSIVEVTTEGLPQVARRKADTFLRVKDGETIVIGGLIQDNLLKNTEKLPILGDIPLLGSLFQSKTEKEDQTELIIFITPHLVQSGMTADATQGMIKNIEERVRY